MIHLAGEVWQPLMNVEDYKRWLDGRITSSVPASYPCLARVIHAGSNSGVPTYIYKRDLEEIVEKLNEGN
jgi:hypothetical protein